MWSGQNNPTGIEPKSDKDTVPFTPYATIKDGFFMACFCILFAWFVFYIPNYLGHADNYIPANPAVTPTHIVPEWYYLPFYAILRAIPNKLLGVIALVASIVILAFLPWLDTSQVRSARYRPLFRQFFWLWVIACIGLGWLGAKPPEGIYVILSRIFTFYYFALLPDHPAAARHLREDQAAAEFDFGIGLWARKREREDGHDHAAHHLALVARRLRSARCAMPGVGAGARAGRSRRG